MKKALLVILLTLSPVALSDAYLGVSLTDLNYETQKNTSFAAVGVTGGYNINSWLAVEANVLKGISEDKAEVDYIWNALGKLTYGSDKLSAYVKGGWGQVQVTRTNTFNKFDSVQYGAGLQTIINDSVVARLEYMRYLDNDESPKMDGVSFSVSHQF